MWGGGGATCILADRFCRGKKNDLLMFLFGLLPRNVHKLWFDFVVIEEILGLPQRNLKLEGTFSGNLIFVDPDALESFSLK